MDRAPAKAESVVARSYGRNWSVDSIASGPRSKQSRLIARLTDDQIADLLRDPRKWAGKGQEPPDGGWSTWLFLGGRGAGKTFAGAMWLTARAQGAERLALIGPTLHDVREVMVEGPSGLKAVAAPGERPRYEQSRRRLVWSSGCTAYAFSAEDPESLRGPQFEAAWADEYCAWPKPEETLALLRMGLRLGKDPRLAVTTTPKPIAALRRLISEPGLVRTDASTADNAHFLAPTFLEGLMRLYGGTRLAAQELDGQVVENDAGALWRAADLARCRGARPPKLERIVVAVDPPASSRGDACGIVVAGRAEGRAYVLEDASIGRQSPFGWAARAVDAAKRWEADALVAEANQGGEMVRSTLGVADPPCPIKLVHASVGKRVRAEPVAALYEQGRVVHCGAFSALEEEMMALGSQDLKSSPDRADALVWALTELMLTGPGRKPRLRRL